MVGLTQDETMAAVLAVLNRRGVKSTLEYPGYLQVGLQQYGTTGETWSGDVYESEKAFLEGEAPIECLTSDIPVESADVKRIADWITCNQLLPKPDRQRQARREAMQAKWNTAMSLLLELAEDDDAFNDAVDEDHGGKYELEESFDEWVFATMVKVRFVPAK